MFSNRKNTFINDLKSKIPNKVLNTEEVIKKHSQNAFYTTGHQPDVVCFADNEQDVLDVVNFCIERKIPIVPYGSGTSVEGHTAAINGGVCLNLSKMNKIIEVNVNDGYVVVQPGISYNVLNDQLASHGVYFPVEAGFGASIGGMVSTNASGAGATDSGSMSKNIFECRLVSYENTKAKSVRIGCKSQKSSAGYNLLGLIAGSEGTLGVITEICLKIRKIPTHYKTICCQFDDVQGAVNFVLEMKGRVQFRKVELMDVLQTKACIAYSNFSGLSSEKNTILIELSGDQTSTDSELNYIMEYLKKNNISDVLVYGNKESALSIWMMRKNACPAAIKLIDPNKKAMATDVSVPVSKLGECIKICYGHMKSLGIVSPLVAHVGDGNFHFTLMIDPANQDDVMNAKKFNSLIIETALSMSGTCTGEHGIGMGKIEYLEKEHGDCLFLMQNIKDSFDPLNLFNPGKIISNQNKCKYENINENQNLSNLSCNV